MPDTPPHPDPAPRTNPEDDQDPAVDQRIKAALERRVARWQDRYQQQHGPYPDPLRQQIADLARQAAEHLDLEETDWAIDNIQEQPNEQALLGLLDLQTTDPDPDNELA